MLLHFWEQVSTAMSGSITNITISLKKVLLVCLQACLAPEVLLHRLIFFTLAMPLANTYCNFLDSPACLQQLPIMPLNI